MTPFDLCLPVSPALCPWYHGHQSAIYSKGRRGHGGMGTGKQVPSDGVIVYQLQVRAGFHLPLVAGS